MQSVFHKNRIITLLKEQGIVIAFIVLISSIALVSDTFLTTENMLLVLRQVSIIGIMAIAMTYVIIGGNFDLSVGSLLSLTTVLMVDLHDKVGPLGAIIIVLIVGLTIGCINGLLIGFYSLNSLIVTLGMLPVLQGITLIYSGGKNVIIQNPEATWFSIFGRGFILGIPVPVIIFLGMALIFGIVLTKTIYGRKLFAVGGNQIASMFAGIRSKSVIFSTFLISSFATSIAGIIMASRVMSSQNNIGQGYELTVIAAVILGGTSLLGGSGSIFKTVIGVLIIGFVNNGLIMLGFPYYTQWLVTWVIIISAVWIDLSSKRGHVFA